MLSYSCITLCDRAVMTASADGVGKLCKRGDQVRWSEEGGRADRDKGTKGQSYKPEVMAAGRDKGERGRMHAWLPL